MYQTRKVSSPSSGDSTVCPVQLPLDDSRAGASESFLQGRYARDGYAVQVVARDKAQGLHLHLARYVQDTCGVPVLRLCMRDGGPLWTAVVRIIFREASGDAQREGTWRILGCPWWRFATGYRCSVGTRSFAGVYSHVEPGPLWWGSHCDPAEQASPLALGESLARQILRVSRQRAHISGCQSTFRIGVERDGT